MVKDARLASDKCQCSSFFIRWPVKDEAIGSHARLMTRVLLVINVNVHHFCIR